MDTLGLRTNLLQQIEEADEKMLRVISSVLDAIRAEYVQEDEELTDVEVNNLPPPSWAKKQTIAERNRGLVEADAECDRGDFITLEALQAK